MQRWITAACLVALLFGCKTKEMKSTPFYEGDESAYTGRVEDRVNLWPLVYWREPACSVLWPVGSFGDDQFALRPLYSQYRQGGRGSPYDEFNFLWPLCQADTASGDYRVFPFFWGEGYFAAFPEVYIGDDATVVLPLAMIEDGSKGTFFPLVFWSHKRGERAFTLFPLYSYLKTPERMRLWGVCGLFGNYRPDTGEYAHWALPFYYANRKGVFSIPWSRAESFDGDVADAYLCGLGGWMLEGGEYHSSWAIPFYYHESGKLITPLFGWGAESDWIMPFYYRDSNSFFTLPYASWSDPETGGKGFLSAPLLTWATWSTNSCRSSWGTLGGLVGANSNATGERRSHWTFPLYHSDAGRSFTSLLYGWAGGGTSQTNTWWATPLVGTSSGDSNGWWAFPLCHSYKDAGFDGLYPLPSEKMLSPDIAERNSFFASDGVTALFMLRYGRTVSGSCGYGMASNRYDIVSSRSRGSWLLSGRKWKRQAKYDMETRRKLSDNESDEATILEFLYRYSRHTNLMTGRSVTRHNVLWKLWDWEEKNGGVRLDVFPFFTYDARSDGYSKTSFLWRFFRYERDPAGGTAVDFLFIPVWR